MTFYDAWLDQSEKIKSSVKQAPRVSKGKELQWVQTRQDARAALMIAPETGFPTGGSLLMKCEIPVGWHTGAHLHGEEAIFVETGKGFLLLDGARYDVGPGTVIHIPYRSQHQLVNTGDQPVVYLSALAWHLEASTHYGLFEQIEDAGQNEPDRLQKAPAEESQFWPKDGRRITLHHDQYLRSDQKTHSENYLLMGYPPERKNGFVARAAAITSIFVEHPKTKSHSHSHPEAYLYALQGAGYSEVDAVPIHWEQGDAVHIPPGMLHHQHFNPGPDTSKELRFEFGIRHWFVDQWEGYKTVHKHLEFSALDEPAPVPQPRGAMKA